jgi:hypothetical protein
MAIEEHITFVVAVNSNEILKANFLSSPLFCGNKFNQFLPQVNFRSASRAYNEAIDRSENDIIVFAHQDIYFPESWIRDLNNALSYLEKEDPKWGVLGCGGVTQDDERWGFLYSTGLGVLGRPFAFPQPIQTLDEIVLIIKKSSGLRFDDTLPHFHFYGTDICMEAKEKGRKAYAMSSFVIHNTKLISNLNKEYFECYKHIKKRWKKYLPIQTTCIRITKFDRYVFETKIREFYGTISGKNSKLCLRAEDPRQIIESLISEKKIKIEDIQSKNYNT